MTNLLLLSTLSANQSNTDVYPGASQDESWELYRANEKHSPQNQEAQAHSPLKFLNSASMRLRKLLTKSPMPVASA